jgi:hypothetical protein
VAASRPMRSDPCARHLSGRAHTRRALLPRATRSQSKTDDSPISDPEQSASITRTGAMSASPLRIDEWAARRRRSSDRGRHGRARSRRSRRRGAAQLPRAHGVELVDEVNPALAVADVDRVPDKRGRRKPKIALDLKPDMTTDSLQLFMKGIGKVRPLSARTRSISPSGSSAGSWTRNRRWSGPTCGWSSRSRSATATRGCRFST